MANGLGIAAGLTGFAEGFAKAFTRRKEIESEQKNRADNFVTEQLIKGALNDPQAVVESPELMQDLEKRLGPQGSVFTQFLQHHASRVQEDSLGAFLGAPEVGQQPAQAAAPETQMIAPNAPIGAGTVLAPPVPTMQPGQAPAVGETLQVAEPPKSRAQRVQERLKPGQTVTKKFGKDSVTLSGAEAQTAKAYQYWEEERAQGLDDITAAQNARTRIIAEKGVPPKFINDLADVQTKADIAAAEAATREAAVRKEKVARPQTAEEFRTSAAQGLTNGYVVGRSVKDDDLLAAKAQNLVLTTLPDGTRIAQPREDALLGGGLILEPDVMLAETAARKIANKSTSQSQNAQMVLNALDSLDQSGAFDLFVEAAPGLGGAVAAEAEAQTKNRLKLYNLRRHGDQRAIAIDSFRPLATAFVKAMGDTGQITEPDKRAFLEFFGRVASGTATRQEARARATQLRGMIESVAPKSVSDREGTDRANTTNSTTTTTLPYNAKVIP